MMNKNLMVIFKRDKDETWWCPDCHKLIRKGSKCSCGCEVFNQVSLVEVLEKLRAKHNRFFQVHPNYNIDKTVTIEMHYPKKRIKWQLSDKSGEVPLHRQSKECQDQIYEVLK